MPHCEIKGATGGNNATSKGVDLKRGRAKNTFNVSSPYCVDNIFLEHIVLQNERKKF